MTRNRSFAIAAFTSTVLASTSAAARADETPPPAQTRTETYRGSIAIADATAMGVAIGGIAGRYDGVWLLGLSSYIVAAPLIHGSNENPRGALASLGLRVALPVAGLIAGYQIGTDRCKSEPLGCEAVYFFLGGVAGAVSASIIDIAFLAETEIEVEKHDPWALHAGSINANPIVAPTRHAGLTLGLHGTF